MPSECSLRASSPGRTSCRAGKGRRACNYVSEYLHRGKSQCEMLIGGDYISNDVSTLGTCFSMFAYILARFRFALIGGNLTAQSSRSHRGTGVELKFQRPSCKLSFLFPPRRQSAPESSLAGYVNVAWKPEWNNFFHCSNLGNYATLKGFLKCPSWRGKQVNCLPLSMGLYQNKVHTNTRRSVRLEPG